MPLDGEFVMHFTKNDELVCKDCVFRKDPAGVCYVFEDHKPLKVLEGGECEAYEKEE